MQTEKDRQSHDATQQKSRQPQDIVQQRRQWLSTASNILLVAALVIALYVVLDRFVLNPAPAGTCPLNNNQPLLYAAIGLCVLSLVLSFFEKKKPEA